MCCGADLPPGAGAMVPLHHPPGPGQRTRANQGRRTSGAQAQDALARRHHAPADVAALVHAAAGRAGTAAAPAPDSVWCPLNFAARSERAPLREHGVLAPNAKLRTLVVPQAPARAAPAAPPAECEAICAHHRPVRLSWAKLLRRVFEIDMEHYPNCGGKLKIIAVICGTAGHREDPHAPGVAGQGPAARCSP